MLIWAVAAMVSTPPMALVERGCPLSADRASASAIRSPDTLVRSLLVDACRRSPSLQRLADAIGRTDGVVYLTIGRCPSLSLRGCLLHTIEDTGNARYLWIRLRANDDPEELIVTMAHELQHALEVLARDNVRSQRDLLDLYQSLDSAAFGGTNVGGSFRTYETNAAIELAAIVRAELSAEPGAVAPDDPD